MELSKRLQAVADLVSEGQLVADVGTDHGYIPIYLVETGKCENAIAMDVNKGPLLRAEQHIAEHGLTERIQVRLSDGVKALTKGDCDCVVIAGMGGALAVKIMKEGQDVFKNLKEFVLQPQSELIKVRQFLWEKEYCITDEDMVLEDGKYYPMMKIKNGPSAPYTPTELRYGRELLQKKHPILRQFLEKELETMKRILINLESESGEHIENRKRELVDEVSLIEEALKVYL